MNSEPVRIQMSDLITRNALLAVLLGLIAQSACYAATGATLGLFFGGIVVAALLIPPLALAEEKLVHRLIIAGGVTDGIALVWLIAIIASRVTLVPGLLCYAMLICWSFALVGLAHLFTQFVRPSVLASAIVVILSLLWLGWPIWLSRLDWPIFVTVHPLFTINAVLSDLGIWMERPIAYQYLMRLGQDIAYALPRGIVPAALVHIVVGCIGVLAGRVVGRS